MIKSMNIAILASMLRLHQWTKSIFIFLGVLYSQAPAAMWLLAMWAAVAFNLVASAVYIFNDICDCDEDKCHLEKARRPIAKGLISIKKASCIMMGLFIIGLGMSVFLSSRLVIILSAYVGVNVLYNLGLRRVPVGDVLCVASGFMLRILAGTLGIGLPMSWWLTITGTTLSLLIALCKRRLEKHTLGAKHRAVLTKYTLVCLDRLIEFAAITTLIFYVLYVWFVHYDSFYFKLTILWAVLGLSRFVWLIFNYPLASDKPTALFGKTSNDPVSLFLSDTFSCINGALFLMTTAISLSNASYV